MREILWFRRDLRIEDSAILAFAKKEVLPIFIFDSDILHKLQEDDKRVTFIYKSVLNLKDELKSIGLDLAIFHGKPKEVFKKLLPYGFCKVLCSVDFDEYALKRDKEVEKLLPMSRYLDSFLLNPQQQLKKDRTPYKVFTPFYKSVEYLWRASHIKEYKRNPKLKKVAFNYETLPLLEELGFKKQKLRSFLKKSAFELLKEFKEKVEFYEKCRDYFYKDATSKLSVHLRFGLISPKQIFNEIRKMESNEGIECFIKELFWREFYNTILYHFPKSEFENFNEKSLNYKNSDEAFKLLISSKTGVPIVDAAMKELNTTGLMHNRLRMVVASYATKNLLIPWKRCEAYFASKLLDYEASSNVGSWQWAASTGADSVPYFRIFNPYTQSKKFDKEGKYIKKMLPKLKEVEAKYLHIEEAIVNNTSVKYQKPNISIAFSRKRALDFYKK